jgi:thiol:disulfide interchange protein
MIRALLACLTLFAASPAFAEALGTSNHIIPTLVAESATPAPGSRVTLAFAMKPDATWHGYWKNPGDAGIETLVEWTADKRLAFGPLQYPVPETLLIAGIMNYVYEHDYAMLVTLDVPKDIKPGTTLPIKAKLDWLACNPQVCVPETKTLDIVLIVGDGHVDPAEAARFDHWRATLPRPLGSPAHFQISGKSFRLEVPLPAAAAADKPYFFPLTDKVVDYSAPQTVTREGDRLVVEATAKDGAKPASVEGVLRLGPQGGGVAFTASPGTVAAVTAVGASEGRSQNVIVATLVALGGAILGGLLLNIMPCVFPILSLKALSLARSGKSEADARGEAIAYTVGVVAVCVALGAFLLVLRGLGQLAGWAFQLQDVRVILALLVLVSAIAFNLAGLFELPAITGGDALASKGGKAGAFWTGALAAFVATPCAGPFLGVALGTAVLLPAPAALAVFGGLGLGLALPFLLLGFVPALRNRLPKPGAWMDRLRRILSVPMFLTALGLAWIAGRQAGVDGMTLALAAALVFTFGLWWVGRRQSAMLPGAWWPLVPALLITGAIATIMPRSGAVATVAEAGHEAFGEPRLAALRAEGRPVLLYFTADWCLTCKVNEKVAIERPEVAQAFAAKKVAVMVGDWTNGDPAISRFLSAHGRSGVPFYLWYPAGGGEPKELPQVLTPGMLSALPA